MAALATLPDVTRQQVESLGRADIVVGIPSYNNADTIGHVVRMAQEGLHTHFGDLRGLIINSDGGSKDGTPERVLEVEPSDSTILRLEHPVYPVQKLSTPYHGLPGKGSAFRTIFQIAQQVGAHTLVVFDSDLKSITPEWVEILATPVVRGRFDFVAPYYTRHKFDGTITNSIVYPMTRALYGKRIRQPIGGDFAFSRALVELYLTQDVWNTDVARFGIDIWATTQAVCGGFRVCQAFLGAKIHNPKDPSSDLSAMLAQVVGSLFQEMERNEKIWMAVKESTDIPLFGEGGGANCEPVTVNVHKMLESFRLGCKNLTEIWSQVVDGATLSELGAIAGFPDDEFVFPDRVWVRVVYSFAQGYHRRVMNRDHLLRALTPLYLGWVGSFVIQMKDAGPEKVESRLEKLCNEYEARKPDLIAGW